MQEELNEFSENQDTGELFEHHKVEVEKGVKSVRVDKFLTNKIVNASRNKIQNAADAGFVFVNGKSVKSNYKVKPDDVITIELAYPPNEFEILPEDIPLNILYEDDDLMVINKEAGMVVHPSYGHFTGTLVNALVHHLRHIPEFNSGDARPGIIHRLDKDTSGILVVAKTEHAKTHLSEQFFNRTTKRSYRALVWGDFDKEEGTVTGNIGRSLKNRKVMDVFPEGDYGKHAVTHYKVLEKFGYITLVECRLETGRTHQIRAHMKHINHPLFNDVNYGGDKILKGTTFTKYRQFIQNCFSTLPRQALHAKSLGFIHPTTGEEMFFDSEMPEDMAQVIEKWNIYIANREM